MDLDRIYRADSRDFLPGIDADTFDLIVTSPDYAERRKKNHGGVPPDEYVNYFLPIAAELKRVLKPTGSFILNIKEGTQDGERLLYVYELVIALREQGWRFVEEYVWSKKNSMPGKWSTRFRDAWERVYHFTRQPKFYMNQEEAMVPVGDWSKSRLNNLCANDKVRAGHGTNSGFGKRIAAWVGRDKVYPSNVISMATECGNKGHSAAFPQSLPEWFIKLLCPPDGVVLDPFVGSGTTCVAAATLGKHYVGIDRVAEYAALAESRLLSA